MHKNKRSSVGLVAVIVSCVRHYFANSGYAFLPKWNKYEADCTVADPFTTFETFHYPLIFSFPT